ncbi:hypothetical protein HanRHA438_Chr02g0090181 [Helianthus annuus]|nr:hypothetical protein HanRHA438_Chr02g0090181 [Helianthus annuus]
MRGLLYLRLKILSKIHSIGYDFSHGVAGDGAGGCCRRLGWVHQKWVVIRGGQGWWVVMTVQDTKWLQDRCCCWWWWWLRRRQLSWWLC